MRLLWLYPACPCPSSSVNQLHPCACLGSSSSGPWIMLKLCLERSVTWLVMLHLVLLQTECWTDVIWFLHLVFIQPMAQLRLGQSMTFPVTLCGSGFWRYIQDLSRGLWQWVLVVKQTPTRSRMHCFSCSLLELVLKGTSCHSELAKFFEHLHFKVGRHGSKPLLRRDIGNELYAALWVK